MIYELEGNVEPDRVGRDFAAYLASGTGRIQYPRDSPVRAPACRAHAGVLPVVPGVSPGSEVARMATTLDSIGQPVGG